MKKFDPAKDLREGVRGLVPTRDLSEAVRGLVPTRDLSEAVRALDPTRDLREAVRALDPTRDLREAVRALDPTRDLREALRQTLLAIGDIKQATIASGIVNLEIQPVKVSSKHRPEEDEQENPTHLVRNPRRTETALPVRPLKGNRAEASDVRNAPPAWAEEVLDVLLPRSKHYLIGDMAQDYHKKYLPKLGPGLARWRYWLEAVKEIAAAWLGR